jgi:protein-tyrosine-phosphatase
MNKKTLYICKNNVGRSQMGMEYHNLLRPGEAESAGTMVDEPGGAVADWKGGPETIIKSMREDHIDISTNLRTQLTPRLLEGYSKIIVMTQPDFQPDYLMINDRVEYWDIPDPHQMSLQETKAVRDSIKRKVSHLMTRRAGRLSPAHTQA